MTSQGGTNKDNGEDFAENCIDFTGGANKDNGEDFAELEDSKRIVGVMTAEEELERIKVALKTALIHRSAKVVERMGFCYSNCLEIKISR